MCSENWPEIGTKQRKLVEITQPLRKLALPAKFKQGKNGTKRCSLVEIMPSLRKSWSQSSLLASKVTPEDNYNQFRTFAVHLKWVFHGK
jgi:hypothetical protein